jgi:hypothetical protein
MRSETTMTVHVRSSETATAMLLKMKKINDVNDDGQGRAV